MPAQDRSVSRRAFCRTAAAVAAAGACVAPAAADEPQPATPPPATPERSKIDVHTHLGRVWNHTVELTAEKLLEWMDGVGIEKAVVLPLVSPESSTFLLTSDFVLEATKPHRDRLIPFCCLDPRTTYSGKRHGLRDMLRRWQDAGAKGFGEHKPGVPIDDPRSMEIYAVCGELKLPVLFHLDSERNTDKPGLPGLEQVLVKFPDTVMIGHGPGWWASIAGETTAADLGGYPVGRIPPGGAMDRLMDKYPNLYGDLSAGSGAGALSRDPEFSKAFLVRRADRLMFGTDYLSPGQGVPQLTLFEKFDLPAEVRAKVFRENAVRVLRL